MFSYNEDNRDYSGLIGAIVRGNDMIPIGTIIDVEANVVYGSGMTGSVAVIEKNDGSIERRDCRNFGL